MPAMFIGYSIPIGYIASRYGWRSAEQGCDALLQAGLCPHCVYEIAGIPPEYDGCVVCPECSAAWTDQRVAPDAERDDPELL